MRAAPLLSLLVVTAWVSLFSAGCTKEEPKVIKEEPKKTTPVPEDMGSFNDFLPKSGPAGGLAVTLDGGREGGIAAVGAAIDGEEPVGDDARPGLKVTEPGAEPRAVRKYAFVPNRVEKRVLTIAQEQSRGGQPGGGIKLVIALDFTAKKVQPTGTEFEAKVTKVDLPGAPAGAQQAQLTQALGGLSGLTGTFTVSPRGEAGELSFGEGAKSKMQNPLAEAVVQGMSQAIELLLPPLPSVPIGVGAKWERSQDKLEGGVEQKAKHLFTAKELTSEGGVVDAAIELKVPKRAIQAQGLPPGAMLSIDGKGNYTYDFRFDRLSTRVAGELAIKQHVEVPDQTGKKQSMDEIQHVKHTIEIPKGAAAAPAASKQ